MTISNSALSADPSTPLLRQTATLRSGESGRDERLPYNVRGNAVHIEDTVAKTRAQGYAFMVLSAACQSLMVFFIRVAESSYNYSSISSVMVRSFTSIVLSVVYLCTHGLLQKLKLSQRHLLLLCFRGIFGASACTCTFFAMKYLPVGTTMTIVYAYPIITSILATIFLKDAYTLTNVVTLLLNFTGIAMTSHASYALGADGSSALIGVGYAVLAAFCTAMILILVRILGFHVHFVLGSLFYGIGCAAISVLLGTPQDVRMLWGNPKGTLFALLSGFAGFGSQSLLTRSLQRVQPGPAAIVGSLSVPLTFAWGLVFLSETTSLQSIIGVALVLLSVAVMAWQKNSRARQSVQFQPRAVGS